MEQYIIYLFYIAVLLILGILITAVCTTLRMSNILFLVIAGFILQRLGFAYFNTEIILVLSALVLILIVVETSMKFNIAHIVKNFLLVLKFNVVYFFVSTYIITLAVFLLFDLPFKGFEAFVLCFLLSIIIYGVDPIIAMEFFHLKKTKLREMLEIEGIISGPIVVIFAFFVISYLQSTMQLTEGIIGVSVLLLQQVLVALLLGLFLAYMVYKIMNNFVMEKELSALMIIAIAIALFVISEFVNANGTLAVAIYGIFLHGLTKETLQRRYTSMVTHILYIIVFILFGMEFFFPHTTPLIKVFALLLVYLLVRFMCLMLFMKDLNIKEKIFMTFNVAKGIEVAIVLFIMKLNFAYLPGIDLILSIGFMFFIMSYVLATIVNYFSNYFLEHHHKHYLKHSKHAV